jgi:2-(1,2-epoxy-1,2-dihydrophenyl)acetyl-CoA isomerase
VSEAPLKVERDGAVLRLTMNRPDAANALSMAGAEALADAALMADEDETIRCVVMTGAGRFFCAGGDVAGMASAPEGQGPHLKRLAGAFHVGMTRLARMRKPLVTVVNGPAAGAGVSMAALGDIALAGASANFTMAYGAIGLSPDGGSTWLLPRLVGLRRAQEMALLNKRISAEEAAQMGLVTRCVPDEELAAEAEKVVAILARSASTALGNTRRLLLEGMDRSFEAQLEAELQSIALCASSPHGKEGIAAFVEKRKPDYS